MMKDKYSARDLMELFFEFRILVPNGIDWFDRKLKNHLPHYYRFKQLESLCMAFNIESAQDLSDGAFIEDNEVFQDFHNRMVFICILYDITPRIMGFKGVDYFCDSCSKIETAMLEAKEINIQAVAKILPCSDREFDKSTLISKFYFPNVDMEEIDTRHAMF